MSVVQPIRFPGEKIGSGFTTDCPRLSSEQEALETEVSAEIEQAQGETARFLNIKLGLGANVVAAGRK